jgi:hypothetical protein
MLHRAQGDRPAPVRAEPTSLLKLVAGEFALRVARLWAAPHEPFLAAPAARRHLVCLALALGRDVAGLGVLILDRRLPEAIVAAAGRPIPGLSRALGRMGDCAWSAEAYRQLLRLLADPKAAKVLRHAERIEQEMVEQLAVLPPPLAGAVSLAARLERQQVELLVEAYEALCFQSGKARAAVVAGRWARFETAKALFAAVKADLCPEPASPPRAGGFRLRPLTSKRDFVEAARRYRNCMAEQTPFAASGWSAYYEWTGEPGAIVEIGGDHIFGWRLEQARLADNEPVPHHLREEIISELALMGVHVGRSGWELDRALRGFAGHWRPPSVEDVVAEAFGTE